MAQYEYMSSNTLKSNFDLWESSMPRATRKVLEERYGYNNMWDAYLNKLGSEGWEISVGGGSYVVYLAKRNFEDRHLDPKLNKDLRERLRLEYEWER